MQVSVCCVKSSCFISLPGHGVGTGQEHSHLVYSRLYERKINEGVMYEKGLLFYILLNKEQVKYKIISEAGVGGQHSHAKTTFL